MASRSFRLSDAAVFLLLGAASAVIVLLAYWYKPAFLNTVNLKAIDAMFAARGAVATPPEVALVAIDEKSVNELGRWPWPRKEIAELILSLKEADVVALDIVFSEKESVEADRRLGTAVKEAGNVILGYFFRDDSTQKTDEAALKQVKRSRVNLVEALDDSVDPFTAPFPGMTFSGIETNLSAIGEGAAGYGAFDAVPDDDGVYRSAYLVYGYGGDIYPSLPLEALKRYSGSDIILTLAQYGIDSISVGDEVVPVDEKGRLSLNYYGKGGSFKTYSAVDVIRGEVTSDEFRGKIIFVGVTEKAIFDIRPTPLDSLYPGVEIHATVAGNVLQHRYLIRDSRVTVFGLFLVVFFPVLLSAIIARVHSTPKSLVIFASMLTLLVIGEYYLFAYYGIKPDVVIYPALSLTLAYISGEAYRNVVVEKKSRYLKKAFSTYVSSQLVSEILRDPDRLKLGGEKRQVTLLFSDIRGFTTLSEKLAPEELVKLLNEYLNPMTAIVLNKEGMLDKYIGDAIMAVFNAPVPIEDHPDKACAAALGMIEKLNELNAVWEGRGYPKLDIGIGINTGEAVVGNMGAELRFDYTAIGDTVNLASRLEGMNKLYSTHIIVSEFTQKALKGQFVFRDLDYVRVKGKIKPLVTYELLGHGDETKKDLSKRFSEALVLYRAMRFYEAREAFEAILGSYPGDGPSLLYIKRCDEYMAHPPEDGWDGVYVAKTK